MQASPVTVNNLELDSDLRVPAGRLGVLVAGLGAIGTTLIVGVEAIKKGLAQPVGSLALLGTLDVGSDGDQSREVPIRECVDLAGVRDLVFGAWDIVDTDAHDAASHAGVLRPDIVASCARELKSIRTWPGVFDYRFNRRPDVTFCKAGRNFLDLADQVRHDILDFHEEHGLERSVVLWCGSTEAYLQPTDDHSTLARLEAAMRRTDCDVVAPSMVYAYAALSLGLPFLNATPSRTVDIPAMEELARLHGAPIAGKDLKTGQTLIKTILAPGLRDRMLGLDGWFSTNILGNGDGATLSDPDAFRTKEESKLGVLNSILRPDLHPDLYGHLHHKVAINYYPPRGDNKESWDAIDIFGWLGYRMTIRIDFQCRDSILAAPLLLDLALFLDLAKRAGRAGPQEWLSFYFKSPMHDVGQPARHDLPVQSAMLRRELHRLADTPVGAGVVSRRARPGT